MTFITFMLAVFLNYIKISLDNLFPCSPQFVYEMRFANVLNIKSDSHKMFSDKCDSQKSLHNSTPVGYRNLINYGR